jgi:hypothetical protein
MAYCPKCREEFESGLMICPDCGLALADQLPAGAGAAVTPDTSWVVLGQVASEIKSEMAKGSLDSNNIPSMILSSSFNKRGSGFDIRHTPHGRTEGNVIMVPREFRDDAWFILHSVLGDDLIESEF